MCAPAYAERVDLLNSAGTTAQGAGTAGKAALTGFNIPAGKRRALFIYAAFERDHCDKPADVCTTLNTGTTGDLSDNFARETGSSTSSNLQITAAVTKGTTTIAKKNALVVGGTPSGSLGYNYAQLKLTPNNTVYFSIESYAIVLNEAEIQTLLGGAASGTVDISFPSIGLPKSTGDEMIVTAYVYNNVEQTVTGIHRVTSNMNTTARTSSMAGNSTITTSTFNTSDMPLGTNDRMLTIGISSMGGPTITGAGFLTHAYMTLIHNFLTNNNTGRFDTVFSNASSEPDGLSLTALDFNSWTSDTSFTFQLGGTSTNKVTAFGVDTYRVVAYNTDTSDGPGVDGYGRADHKPVAGGIR
jgi:hypothetical protein